MSLLKFHKTNELLIYDAVDKLIHRINKAQLNPDHDFEKILSELDGVSSVLCFDSLYYYGCQEEKELTVLVVELVKFGLLLTQKITDHDIVSSKKISSLDDVILETDKMLAYFDTLKKRQPIIDDDQALLCRALQEIIDDEDWLAIATQMSDKNQVSQQAKDSSNDKTMFLSAENNLVDKTIVMSSKGEQKNKQDDALIMSSINRILRQI